MIYPIFGEQAHDVLNRLYITDEEAEEAIESLFTYYANNYPEIYAERKDEIGMTVDTLKEIYDQFVFREQKIDWDTHSDNLGHKYDPGCFRCHDGKHLTGEGEAIRLECNLCHSIPVQVNDASLVTQNLKIPLGPEPPSHTHTSWITLHGQAIDTSCAACHAPEDPDTDYMALDGKTA